MKSFSQAVTFSFKFVIEVKDKGKPLDDRVTRAVWYF